MKVIADNKISYIKEATEQIADEVVYAPGKDFTPELIHDADALIIRTRTHCNRPLLAGSKVKFIVTATIGFDHIDTAYCREAGITWTNAPGCNPASVAQYIQSAPFILQQIHAMKLYQMTIGIVGVGNVGSKVADVARKLGMRVMLNDLPRVEKEESIIFTTLENIAKECDIIILHVPLYKEGKYKTYHLVDKHFFRSLKKGAIAMNTSRGEVIETEALLDALQSGTLSDAVIDAWEHEPDINLKLLEKVITGTSHIAGYSADGKANAIRMSLEVLCRFFRIEAGYQIVPPEPENKIISATTYEAASLQIYDPRRDSDALKTHPKLFEQLRGDYPLRREEGAYKINTS